MIKYNRAQFELLIWSGLFLVVFGLALRFNGHEALDHFFQSHEQYDLDEVFTAISIAGALGLVYSLIRMKDLAREIERRIAAEKNVDWIACHDPLTNLPNRRMFGALSARPAPGAVRDQYAVFSIDLDGFKKINDLLGHAHGDEALKIVAERLSAIFPGNDVYRVGGDEFAVVIKIQGDQDLVAVARHIVEIVSKPIVTNGATVDMGASVGLALYPEDSDEFKTALQYADCAMYAAKKAGRNNVRTFASSMQQDLVARVQMEAALKKALNDGRIRPHYQPLVDLKTQEIVGFEALARWETESGAFVSPSDFIPVAEDAGLIIPITDYLFETACRDALSWPSHITLSFNISPVQLSDRLLGLRLLNVMREVGLSPHRVELEVTESALIQDTETAREVLSGLTAAGIKIALDDFGTGFSSLSQLSNYQFDKIKIDKSFVATFETNEKQEKLVRAIISLGTGLSVKITAEGIETQTQLQRLRELGCDIGQGYLFGRPAPIDQVTEIIRRRPAASAFSRTEPDDAPGHGGLNQVAPWWQPAQASVPFLAKQG
ncbi:putative bifunctional diguanylate cyclase/phosphodiesterase [Rhizobium sp. Rhizsp42]|uniref:putative bifunctional diguanylate cyclase/phosphodiesterase n=1 Tax=Rhizobium sp. Rhizsp42 TaxID=3243034 RepID=UPI0039AED584